MAGAKEIRTQIASITSTQKITKAMEMVAASKMRKTQDRMAAGRPYAKRMMQVVGHVANANPEYKHIYLAEREVKRVGFIILSTDRGLCGGLNINCFKAAIGAMKEWNAKNVPIDLCVIGAKGQAFFRGVGGNVVSTVRDLGDAPRLASLIGPVKVMLDAYAEGRIDRLFLVSNGFVNTMTQKPEVEQLLPLVAAADEGMKHHWDYIYEGEPRDILEGLLIRYIEATVHQAAVENVACEMAARMMAMKNATDNAKEIIGQLKLAYNKARQAAITTELSEIISGAAAV